MSGNGASLEKVVELAGQVSTQIAATGQVTPPGAEDNRKEVSPGFRFFRASDLEVTRPEYLGPDKKFEKDTLASIFGDPESGKTFYAIHLGCSIAARGATVFYIAGEGQRGIPRRLRAWCIEHAVDLVSLPLYFSMAPAQVNDEDCVGQVIEAIRELVQANGDPALVVIDTLAHNLEGDENSPVDMGAFLRGVDRIRAQFHCTILVLHHPGHLAKERSRGHSCWKGALDTEYRLAKDGDGTIRMTCTKSKDSAPPESCAFELKTIPIGLVDDDGRDVFSAVLVPTDYEPARAPGKTGHGKWQTAALGALEDLTSRCRANLEADGRDPDCVQVSVDDWRAACVAAGMPRKRFYDVKDALIEAGLVTVEQGFVSSSRPAVRPCPVVPLSKDKGDKPDNTEPDQSDKPDTIRTANRTQTGQAGDTFEEELPFPGKGDNGKLDPGDIF